MLLAVTWLSGHVRPCFCQHEVPSCALSQSLPGRVFMEAVRESSFCLQGLWPVSPRWMWWHLGFWGLKPGFSQPQKSKHLCISLSQFSEWKLDASCLSPRWVPILLNYCWHWLCSPLTFPSLSPSLWAAWMWWGLKLRAVNPISQQTFGVCCPALWTWPASLSPARQPYFFLRPCRMLSKCPWDVVICCGLFFISIKKNIILFYSSIFQSTSKTTF